MKKIVRISAFIAIVVLSTYFALAQQTGTIRGKFKSSQEIKPKKVFANLIESSTSKLVQKVEVASYGEFSFYDVPYNNYTIRVYSDSIMYGKSNVNVISAMPLQIEISETSVSTDEVNVSSEKGHSEGGGYFCSYITYYPEIISISSNKKIENMILSTPGVVPDEDGRLHIRGEDAQIQYIIDGIPVTSNQTRVYSSLFNANIIESMYINRSGFNAEYGVANAGVININTKSGFSKPIFGSAFAQMGSFNSKDYGVDLGGNFNQKFAYYFAYSNSESDRYLDPIQIGDPIHDFGKSKSFFSKLDYLITDKIDLNILGSYGTTNYEIPNFKAESKQNQNQELTNYLIGARLNWELSESSVLSFLAYSKGDKAVITSDGLNRMEDYVDALKNDKFFIAGNRDNKNNGGMIELSTKFFDNDVAKIGIGGEVFPLKEYLTFAVTNRALSTSDSSGGDSRYIPYDITKGGKPFLVDTSLTGKRFFAFIQEAKQYGDWYLSYGLRFDNFHIFNSENNLTWRIRTEYQYAKDLTFVLGYDRVVMMSPVENLLVSASPQAALLTGAEQAGVSNQVKSQKSHNFDIGASWRLNENLTIEIAGFTKLIDDFLVKVELGNSGVIFPANLKNGFIAGGEISMRLKNWNNISGYWNISSAASFGINPSDGSSPVSAGLILGEEGHNYRHPFGGEDMFPTEHNQLLTSVFNFTYRPSGNNWENRTWYVSLGGRFDMGLPFDLIDSAGKGYTPDQARSELKRRGYTDKVIDLLDLSLEKPGSPDKSTAPHITFDISAGINLKNYFDIPIELKASIINIFNTTYLYKFESAFSGTHFGMPRMVSIRVDFNPF